MKRKHRELPWTIPHPDPSLTMAGDDVNIDHRTAQLLEHLEHGALAGGDAPCQAHQEHLPGKKAGSEAGVPEVG